MSIYLLLKSLHIIAIIAWMAGLLYLPRIYVYHCQTTFGSEAHEKFVQMEYIIKIYYESSHDYFLDIGHWINSFAGA